MLCLHALHQLCGHTVKVSTHWSFHSHRGMIRSPDLLYEKEEELLLELTSEGVVGVKRITRKADDDDLPTPSVILTFRGNCLPGIVEVGFLRVRVRPFIPIPSSFTDVSAMVTPRPDAEGRPYVPSVVGPITQMIGSVRKLPIVGVVEWTTQRCRMTVLCGCKREKCSKSSLWITCLSRRL
jgi:hypothetical protein